MENNNNADLRKKVLKKLQDPSFYTEEPIHTDEFKKYVDLDGHEVESNK
jgi:hypothetical protein